MVKLRLASGLVLSLLLGAAAHAAPAPAMPELVVYAYDSLVAKGGLGSRIFPLFEKKCGCRVKTLAVGDGAQLLSRLQLDAERGKPGAHVVLGIDQNLWDQARPYADDWGDWRPRGYEGLLPEARAVGTGFLPFDYGVFAFMADTSKVNTPPRSLAELLKPEWKRNLILEDPRTSTPGLGFVLFVESMIPEAAKRSEFWGKARQQWLTLAPGWDQAYGLFLKGEAPLVWSYTTSQAYHAEHGDAEGRYRAVVFDEGNPVQIEGALLVKGASSSPATRKLAREFLAFLISPAAQEEVPRGNWMLPVVPGTKVPESFRKLPKPVRLLSAPRKAAEVKAALAEWERAIR